VGEGRDLGDEAKALFMAKRYTVSDGKLLLTFQEAAEGGFVVTSPLDPELVTEGDTVGQCFEMARDALKALKASRAKLFKNMRRAKSRRC
jgi:predicted RNase H-like HicB family nuclease